MVTRGGNPKPSLKSMLGRRAMPIQVDKATAKAPPGRQSETIDGANQDELSANATERSWLQMQSDGY